MIIVSVVSFALSALFGALTALNILDYLAKQRATLQKNRGHYWRTAIYTYLSISLLGGGLVSLALYIQPV